MVQIAFLEYRECGHKACSCGGWCGTASDLWRLGFVSGCPQETQICSFILHEGVRAVLRNTASISRPLVWMLFFLLIKTTKPTNF